MGCLETIRMNIRNNNYNKMALIINISIIIESIILLILSILLLFKYELIYIVNITQNKIFYSILYAFSNIFFIGLIEHYRKIGILFSQKKTVVKITSYLMLSIGIILFSCLLSSLLCDEKYNQNLKFLFYCIFLLVIIFFFILLSWILNFCLFKYITVTLENNERNNRDKEIKSESTNDDEMNIEDIFSDIQFEDKIYVSDSIILKINQTVVDAGTQTIF